MRFFCILEIDDFVIDWPLGYVYYISLSSPKLTVCNITGTACKILDASLNLTSPSEIILDPVMRYVHQLSYVLCLPAT